MSRSLQTEVQLGAEKRTRDEDAEGRPRKLQCQVRGSTLYGVPVKDEADDGSKNVGQEHAAGSWTPSVITVAASSGSRSLSDWSAMEKALPLGGALKVDHGLDSDDVVIPEDASFVRLRRQTMLTQIVGRLNLDFHAFAVVFDEEVGLHRAWLEIDTPRVVDGKRQKEKFIGAGRLTPDAARESAADVAIKYLVSKCSVIVDDVNFEKITKLEERCSFAEFYSAAMYDESEIRKNQLSSMYKKFGKILDDAKTACKKFDSDVPLRFVEAGGAFPSPSHATVMYTGPRPAISALDEVSQALAVAIAEGTQLLKYAPV